MSGLGRAESWVVSSVRRTLNPLVLVMGLVFGLMMGLWGCGKNVEPDIGNRVYAPFDIVRIERWKDYVVLNSNYDGFYRNGSLLRVSEAAGGTWEKKQTVSIPRLGTRLAVDSKESKMALAFSGARPEIRIYPLLEESISSESSTTLLLPDDLVITDIDWVNVSDQGQTAELLLVELGGNNRTGKVRVYAFREGRLEPLFTIPDDLPNARNPVYELGHSAAVYEPKSNMLVFFPSGGAGVLGDRPSPYEVLTSGAWSGTTDLRTVSLVAIDLDHYFVQKSLVRSAAYVPVILNDAFVQGNADLPAKDESNASLTYRTLYTEAAAAQSASCTRIVGDLPSDTVLAALYGSGHVLKLSGWLELKAALAAKGHASEDIGNHFFTKELKMGPYSLGDGAGAHPRGTFRVTALRSVVYGDDASCLPIIVRADVKTSDDFLTNAGREDVWVSHSLGRTPADPAVSKVPERSALRFAGTGSDLVFVSYSKNSICSGVVNEQGFRFDPAFKDGP